MARTPDAETMPPGGPPSSDGATTSETPAAESPGSRRVLPAPLRALVSLPKWVWLVVVLLLIGSIVPFGEIADVPESIHVRAQFSGWVNNAVDWMVVTWDPFFRAINIGVLRYLLLPLEGWLQSLPWWLIIVVVAVIALRIVGPIFSVVAVALMLVVAVLGIFELAMSTLALVIVATLLAVVLGIPAGILAARSDRFNALLGPVLDIMQTMPSFVYLIPVLMLFGLGKVPAILATVIEAARAFGSTTNQLLFKVQIPLALPTVMAGLNQTIMMGLAMVVIAAIIGARGLGVEVLNGIARLDVGRGLIGGIGIVVMAIILDRITQGFARSRQRARSTE